MVLLFIMHSLIGVFTSNFISDDVGRESVPFVSIHPLIPSIQRVNLAIPFTANWV